MKLVVAQVTSFKSIDDSGPVEIDPAITVLVGQNESGKTAFLQALYKARPIDQKTKYSVTDDYPRRGLTAYEKKHAAEPAVVVSLTYKLLVNEIEHINQVLGFPVLSDLAFTVNHDYADGSTIDLEVPEEQYIGHLLQTASLSSETMQVCSKAESLNELVAVLDSLDLNVQESAFLSSLKERFGKSSWDTWLAHYIWTTFLSPKIPSFLYFDDYYLLPGKVNLPTLQQRVKQSEQNSNVLLAEDKTVLGLLRMAGVDLDAVTQTTGYENIKAKLEAIQNSVTDKVFDYWTQNQELEVEFDIRQDPQDQAPFNSGNNLYIRIKNKRHRVTVPFSQRSKGFIWFFSFIVWFDSIQEQTGSKSDLVLLLDEPGLSLHALAQADFLRYIDDLGQDHQILYSTHSPFMVHSDRLHQVRTVEDRAKEGTKVSANVSGADANTIFPLQAALGYTIAQNLFISKKNLLVEGPADLIYLRFFSNLLSHAGKPTLRDDITIVPVGGLDKVATFIALLRGNELQIAVLHDYVNKPDQRIESVVREKLIRDKQVLNYAMFRGGAKRGAAPHLVNSDVEDMLSVSLYLRLFSAAYSKELNGTAVAEKDLPPGDRIVERLNQYLQSSSIQLRASGGYNHYLVANYLASNPLPPSKVDRGTLDRFESLFATVNALFASD